MTHYCVEPSGESLPLATAETEGAAEALGGSRTDDPRSRPPGNLLSVELDDDDRAARLAERLALAWRVLRPWPEDTAGEIATRFRSEGASGRPAALRPMGSPRTPIGTGLAGEWALGYREGGGIIDLELPQRRFYVAPVDATRWWVAEEVAAVDRRAYSLRRLPQLPYRRPVSLPPRLGRVLVNLARVRPGDRVVDPFVGTGALLVEAALLGAKVTGIDRDPEMVRGAIRNFGHLRLEFERVEVADAETAPSGATPWDAVVTDPPYGRASGSGGEDAGDVIRRVLPHWAERVRPGGYIALAVPQPLDVLGEGWELVAQVPDRVHRSLTREFRAYRRTGGRQKTVNS
ncbi:MAG: methyltransferase domain-containing protein [Thermoplasmata archaeon]|nr:methyltransferase domain-containing protein [Thermoplasmata archaeon]